jgi:ketosteroid isomerase-like protein
MQPAEVVRAAWGRYATGDIEGSLQFFAPGVVWHSAPGFPGPSSFVGRDELRRWALGLTQYFSTYEMKVTDVRDLGEFVLAHGALYAEKDGEVVIDRVTLWRCYVSDGLIVRVDADEAG